MRLQDGLRDRRSRAGRLQFHARTALLMGIVFFAASPIQADNVYTSTGAGGAWSNPANWISGTSPASGIDTQLDFAGSGPFSATFTDDIGAGTFTVNELQLASSSTGTEFIAANTAANTLTFTANSLSTGPQILQNGSGAFSIGNSLILNATLTIGGLGAGGVSLGGTISGPGGLTIDTASVITLGGANSYTGVTTINSGLLSVSLLTTEGTGTTGSTASGIGQSNNLAANLVLNGGTLQYTGPTATTDRLFTLGSAGGALDASGSGAIAFTNIGSIGFATPNTSVTLDLIGTSTAGNTLRSILANNGTGTTSLLKSGAGTWVLSGPNSFTGNVTLLAGTLDLNNAAGSLSSSANLNFTGAGTFLYENNNATANHSQTVNQISFGGGDATVQIDYTGANHSIVLFTNAFVRLPGGTGNFVVSGGSNENNVGIYYLPSTQGFISVGDFFDGSTYAWIDGNSFVVPITYSTGSTAPAFTTSATTISGTHQYVQATAAVSNQPSLTLTSLNLAGSNNFALQTGATLTVNGILKSGNGAGAATISSGLGIEAASGAELVIRTDQSNDALAVDTPILADGANPLTKSGAGTLTFGSVNSYTGTTTINAGAVNFAGASGSTGGGFLVVGGTGGNALMNVATSGAVTFNGSDIGGITGAVSSPSAAGAIDQISGNFNYSNGTAGYLELGTGVLAAGNPGGYGSYSLAGGTLTSNGASSGIRVGSVGLGSFLQSGGNLVLGRELSIGTYGTGVATFTGGAATTSTGYGILVGDVAGTGTLNLGTQTGGNATLITQASAGIELAASSGTIGTLNLNSGTILINSGSLHKGAGSSGVINFNGATLQAGASNLTLIDNSPTAVNVYDGGAVIDTQGFTDTISAPLLATLGDGIYPAGGAFSVANGGSGYIGPPLVSVSGGSGSGAAASATLAGGIITGVTLTNPGQNYQAGDILNFSFAGGGATVAAPTFAYSLRVSDLYVNSAGGLTKLGTGTLILSATNTYVGATNIISGTLEVDGSLANTLVNVEPGGTLAGKGTISNAGANSISIAGTIAPGTPSTNATLTTGPMTWTGGGTYVWKVSQLPSGSPASGAGTNWDNLNVSNLAISATSSNPFNVSIVGNPSGFSNSQAYTWQIAAVLTGSGGTITGFNPSALALNVAQFNNGSVPASDFSLTENDQSGELLLSYSPAPEPSSIALLASASAALLMRRRRLH